MKTRHAIGYVHFFVAFLLLLMSGKRAHSQTILNGGFESAVVPTNSITAGQPSDWSGNAAFIFNGDNGPTWPLPHSGNQFVDVGNSSSDSLEQSFTITMTQTYTVTWFDSTGTNGSGSGNATYDAAILDGAQQPVVGISLDASTHQNIWQLHSLESLLTPGTYSFRILPTGIGTSQDVMIDDVSIVPEPTSLLLLVLGTVLIFRPRSLRKSEPNA